MIYLENKKEHVMKIAVKPLKLPRRADSVADGDVLWNPVP